MLLPRVAALLAVLVLSSACSVTAPDGDGGKSDRKEDNQPPPLKDCEDHTDCAGGEACRDGKCRTVCEADDECTGYYGRCETELGYCVACVTDEHCDSDERCSDHLCVFHCSSNRHCKDGELCDLETGECFERECERNADCQGGYVCTEGRCVSIDPVICEANTSRCQGNEVVTCNRDGTRETRTACENDEVCVVDGDLAACVAQVCAPNEIGCASDDAAYVCDASGTQRTELPCNASQFCDAGVCRNQVCEPSSVRCDGGSLVLCDERGASSTSASCDLTASCQEEPYGCACVDAACTPRVCQPGTGQCVGNGYRRCNADGTAYEAPVACAGGEVCAGGACVPSTCSSGETRCSGDMLLTCNASNNGWVETSCSASGETCVTDGNTSSCGERVCEPLSRVCSADGRSVLICDGIGSERTTAPCDDDEYCQGGVCHPQVCEPGTATCAGPASRRICNADGSAVSVSACPSGNVCEDGACVPVTCTPDCSGRVCGPDPVCGSSCGTCDGVCDSAGQCQAPAAGGLEVVLTWNTDDSDIDILLSKRAEDGLCSANTCGYDSCRPNVGGRPDWDGSGGPSEGDPLLEVDNTQGYGPEKIVLASPANGTYYARVHAYRLGPGQTTTATVTVRANGVVIGTFSQLLTGNKDLWEGVTITWNGNTATATASTQVTPNQTCGSNGSGLLCEHAGQCPDGEFCSWSLLISGSCTLGCANDSDCLGNQKCNGAGQCVPSGTNLANDGESCSNDGDCSWGLTCGMLIQVCRERCVAAGNGGARSCAGDPDCCPRTGLPFCKDDILGISASCSN